ncbi:hypothetical protein [Aeromonas veronii]|uniref:hypothetical protein n=1 Tax=Aeromonas veronii TaxID=654 RepID=UPI0015E650F4|nr:hypothetical protein [Aeromonas veronii]MBA2083780.1 hypothetical protein [Aeromonas veronii]
MNDLITAIKAWPIIVQGALGSGLFWLILVLLQKISLKITGYLSHLFKESEKSEIRTELLKILMTEAAGIEKLNYAAPILYRMARPFLRAILWLVLGLFVGSIISIFGIIGYIGSIYYLLQALNVVSAYKYNGDLEERKSVLSARLKELEENV